MLLFENLFCYRFVTKVSEHSASFLSLRRAYGLQEVRHLSTFPHAAKWFREQGFSDFCASMLKDLGGAIPVFSHYRQYCPPKQPYDLQAKWGMSARYQWFNRYKLHLCTTTEGIILSHIWTTANRNDALVTPKLLSSLQEWKIELVLGDAVYDSENVRKTAEQVGIFFVSSINQGNSEERKDAYGRVVSVFLKTRFGKWLFGFRSAIERVFNQLKSDGLE